MSLQLQHSNGSSRIWCKHEGLHPCCLLPSEHHLNATAYLSVAEDQVPPFMTTVDHLLVAASSRILHTDLRSSQTGFWTTTMSSPSSSGLHGHHISIQWSPFGMWRMPVTLASAGSIRACYRLQLETFTSLFLARHELQPHCVPVCSTQKSPGYWKDLPL